MALKIVSELPPLAGSMRRSETELLRACEVSDADSYPGLKKRKHRADTDEDATRWHLPLDGGHVPPSGAFHVRGEAGHHFDGVWRLRDTGQWVLLEAKGPLSVGDTRHIIKKLDRWFECTDEGRRADQTWEWLLKWWCRRVGGPEGVPQPEASTTLRARVQALMGDLSWETETEKPAVHIVVSNLPGPEEDRLRTWAEEAREREWISDMTLWELQIPKGVDAADGGFARRCEV